MVSVEKGGILVTSFLWLWILSHGNVVLAFSAFILLELSPFVSGILTSIYICAPDTSTCSINLACGAAVLCLHHAGKKSTTMCHTQQDAQKKHSVLLLIDTVAVIVTGFSQSHLLCITQQDVVSSLYHTL